MKYSALSFVFNVLALALCFIDVLWAFVAWQVGFVFYRLHIHETYHGFERVFRYLKYAVYKSFVFLVIAFVAVICVGMTAFAMHLATLGLRTDIGSSTSPMPLILLAIALAGGMMTVTALVKLTETNSKRLRSYAYRGL